LQIPHIPQKIRRGQVIIWLTGIISQRSNYRSDTGIDGTVKGVTVIRIKRKIRQPLLSGKPDMISFL
jgi:hypothetical protein